MYYLYINICITCILTSVLPVYQQLNYLYINICITCISTAVLPVYQHLYYLYINSWITCILTSVLPVYQQLYYLYINICIIHISTSVLPVYQQLFYLYINMCITCISTADLPVYQHLYYLYINSCITCIFTGLHYWSIPGILYECHLYMQHVTCALGVHYLPQTVSGCWPPWWTLSWLTLRSLPPPSPVCGWWGALHWSSGCQTCLSGSAPVQR